MIEIFAPAGIGEVHAGDDVAAVITAGIADETWAPLQDGDVLVVTSKIISKAEGQYAPSADRQQAIDAETVRTVARRKSMAIVETPHGLTQAGAGVDNSNVDPADILLLPKDPDASAERLRAELSEVFGVPIGVIISDTAGRAWRLGQTDHAIGAAGIRVLDSYAGRRDGYGNDLQVTAIAIADELAAAADLAKSKLSGRPVAVIRGIADQVVEPGPTARELLRTGEEDLFHRGSREAVLAALLSALGHPERYEAVVRLDDRADLLAAITAEVELTDAERHLVARLIAAAQPLW